MPLSVLTSVSKLVLQVMLVSIWLTALMPVILVLLVILSNNISYSTSTLTDQSSNTAVGSTKLSPLCNGFITSDAGTPVSPTKQIKRLPVYY